MNPTSERVPEGRIWSVSALVQAVADALHARFGTVRVCGELSACTEAASGHRYFSLKDTQGQGALIRCAMFRRASAALTFTPKEGLKVEALGRLAMYEPRGDLQFIVESLRLLGAGSLYEEFLRLKARLQAEGLFDGDRKRTLPSHPVRLGLVCSLQAAALRDVLTVVARRAPHVEVVIYPCLVQGTEAPASIVLALQAAARRAEVDALILARGGGSLEDLWAFNDERVVRAVAQCPIPLVCGVGHETDVTLADFAADVRAATPTAAAELLTTVRDEELERLSGRAQRLGVSLQRALDRLAQHLDQVALAVLRPAAVLARHQQGLQRLHSRLMAAAREPLGAEALALQRRAWRLMAAQTLQLSQAQHRLQQSRSRIEAQDPRSVLRRGYAWISDAQGRPLTTVEDAVPGAALTAVWHDGSALVRVETVATGADGQNPRPATGAW